jgi:aspartate racemase
VNHKTLGILGGMGPESTIEYYRLLVSGYRERAPDHSYPSLLINSIDVNKVLTLAAAAKRELLVEYLTAGLLQLARAGADYGLLAANTPHIVFPEVSRKSPLPLISIVQATCDFAKKRKFTRLGLFGTRSTMQAGFYQQVFREQGIDILLPGIEEQNYINAKYVGELIAGHFLPETRERLLAIVKKLKDAHGIEGLILGGTELPLLLRGDAEVGIPFLDTTRIHVQAALESMFS